MADLGYDGIFDRSMMGVAVWNPSVIRVTGTTNRDDEITPVDVPMHPALRYAAILARDVSVLVDDEESVHGPDHWKRVERNGAYIASKTNADPLVVGIFAKLHDSCRESDKYDEEHGPRAARMVMRDERFKRWLSEPQIEKLVQAMDIHTSAYGGIEDPTIGACLDSDRLDMARLGCEIETEYLSTEPAKEIAANYGPEEIVEGAFLAQAEPETSLPARSQAHEPAPAYQKTR